MENLHLTLYVDNVSTMVSGRLKGPLYKAFKREMGYIPEDYIWRAQNNPNWDGCITTVCYSRDWCRCPDKKDGMHFPTGLLSKAIAFFKANGVTYSVNDVRDTAVAQSFRSFDLALAEDLVLDNGKIFKPYDYQIETIEKSIKAQRGIIKISTGGGKTVCAAGIIAALGVKPVIFYVTSIDLLRQAKSEIEKYVRLSGSKLEVGAVGGGFKNIRDITVMTVQTAVRALDKKYIKFDDEDEDEDDTTDISDIKKDIAELISSARCYVSDEIQHWASDTCQIIADYSKSARWRFGMSATPFRDKGDDILIDACFGKQIVDINASWLIQHGFLVKPYIAFLPVNNMKGQQLGAWPSVYKNAVVENSYRNNMIAELAHNLEKKGRLTLILIQQIVHGEILQSLIPNSVFLHGSCTKNERKNHIELMRSGHAPITVASSIYDEGVDIKPLNALILAGGGKSPTRALQRVGRVLRLYDYPDGTKKENAFVYDIYDHQKYVTPHALSRKRIYGTEPEFDVRMA